MEPDFFLTGKLLPYNFDEVRVVLPSFRLSFSICIESRFVFYVLLCLIHMDYYLVCCTVSVHARMGVLARKLLPFLFCYMGFGTRWRGWVTTLLSFATTSMLLNGARGSWFRHRKGLRQGDPLSLLLFILAMEPLHKMLKIAETEGLLSPIHSRSTKARLSMYADDVAIFLKSNGDEMKVISDILEEFGGGIWIDHKQI